MEILIDNMILWIQENWFSKICWFTNFAESRSSGCHAKLRKKIMKQRVSNFNDVTEKWKTNYFKFQ